MLHLEREKMKKIIKKSIAVVLLAIMSLNLVACQKNGETPKTTVETQTETSTLEERNKERETKYVAEDKIKDMIKPYQDYYKEHGEKGAKQTNLKNITDDMGVLIQNGKVMENIDKNQKADFEYILDATCKACIGLDEVLKAAKFENIFKDKIVKIKILPLLGREQSLFFSNRVAAYMSAIAETKPSVYLDSLYALMNKDFFSTGENLNKGNITDGGIEDELKYKGFLTDEDVTKIKALTPELALRTTMETENMQKQAKELATKYKMTKGFSLPFLVNGETCFNVKYFSGNKTRAEQIDLLKMWVDGKEMPELKETEPAPTLKESNPKPTNTKTK